MLYAIIATDIEDSLGLRKQARPKHLERLELLKQEGRLILAGPYPNIDNEDPGESGYSGSLIVAEFPSLVEAKQWAMADPYQSAGVYQAVVVKPFKKVFP